MEVTNNPGEVKPGKHKNESPASSISEAFGLKINETNDLPALHSACLYGELNSVQELLSSKQWWINNCDSQGLYPIHMVVFSGTSPQTADCLKCLLENEADVNVITPNGQTPLHIAATNGLFRCVKILVKAGADVTILDSMGFTPFDLARIWCKRDIGRYLKNCMWHTFKKKEMEKRIQVQLLYKDIVKIVKFNKEEKKALIDKNMAEWAKKKGFTLHKDLPIRILGVSQYHIMCLVSDSTILNLIFSHDDVDQVTDLVISYLNQPIPMKPWCIFTAPEPERPPQVPDLRNLVILWRNVSTGVIQYTLEGDDKRHHVPHLPLDVIERVLFPRAFRSRMATSEDYEPKDIVKVSRRARSEDQNDSSWTEVSLHLVEILEPCNFLASPKLELT